MNNLEIELQINDDSADVVLNRTEQKIENFASKVEGLNPSLGKKMALDFELAERRADSVARKLATIAGTRIDHGQFDGITRAAIGLENRANGIKTELAAIRTTASQATNASILTQLQTQAKGLEAELAKVEVRQSRIGGNSPSSGSGGHGLSLSNIANGGQIRGAGPLFRAAGLYQYGIDESILNVANSARVAIGLSGEALAAFGGVAAAGFAVYEISEKIRSDAEKRLQVEEDIAGAFNRQIKGIEEMYASYDKFKQLVESSDKFSLNISHLVNIGDGKGLQDLLNKVDADNKVTIEKINNLQKDQINNEFLLEGAKNRKTHSEGDKGLLRRFASNLPFGDLFAESAPDNPLAGPGYSKSQKDQDIAHRASLVEQNKKDLADLAETLKAGQEQFTQLRAAINQTQGNQVDAFHKNFQDSLKRSEEFNKSVEKGMDKVRELPKNWNSAFESLNQRVHTNNPFALFLEKSATDADKLKESLRGLPPELQKTLFAMKAIADVNDLFGLRLGAAVDAAGLRADAKAFSNPAESAQQQQDRINRQFLSAINPGGYFGYNRVDPSKFSEDQRRNIAANSSFSDIMGSSRFGSFQLSQEGVAIAAYRSFHDRQDSNGLQEGKLRDQLAALERFKPADTAQQSELDRKVIALTQGVDVTRLSDRDRTFAAAARLNEASRADSAEQQAKADRKEELEVRKKFIEAVNKLADIAEKDGVQGVQQQLKVILENETKGEYNARVSSPTPDDVSANYGSVSGPDGLTNF
jgi:hypothetical protein